MNGPHTAYSKCMHTAQIVVCSHWQIAKILLAARLRGIPANRCLSRSACTGRGSAAEFLLTPPILRQNFCSACTSTGVRWASFLKSCWLLFIATTSNSNVQLVSKHSSCLSSSIEHFMNVHSFLVQHSSFFSGVVSRCESIFTNTFVFRVTIHSPNYVEGRQVHQGRGDSPQLLLFWRLCKGELTSL